MLELFRQAPQFIIGQRLAFGTFRGHVPRHRFADVLGPLSHTLVLDRTSSIRQGTQATNTIHRFFIFQEPWIRSVVVTRSRTLRKVFFGDGRCLSVIKLMWPYPVILAGDGELTPTKVLILPGACPISLRGRQNNRDLHWSGGGGDA